MIPNSDKHLSLAIDATNETAVLKLKEILGKYSNEEWSASRIDRAIQFLKRNEGLGEMRIFISLDFMYASKYEKDESGYYEETNMYVLERDLTEYWGKLFKKYRIIPASAGSHYDAVVQAAKDAAIADPSKNSIFDFNGVTVIVSATTNLEYLDRMSASYFEWETVGPDCVEAYTPEQEKLIETKKAEQEAKWNTYIAEQAKEDEKKQKTIFEKIEGIELDILPEVLDQFNEGKAKNTDPYGGRCYTYADEWGRLMQVGIAEATANQPENSVFDIQGFITSIANETSQEADYDGITGFMYGASVSILSHAWRYGEYLRKWHNKEHGYEGSGVVNPAVMTISVPE